MTVHMHFGTLAAGWLPAQSIEDPANSRVLHKTGPGTDGGFTSLNYARSRDVR